MNARSVGTAVTLFAAIAACSGSSTRSSFGSDTNPTDAARNGSDGFGKTDAGTGLCAINNAGGDPNSDPDGDGYPLGVDCNECDPNTNPGAYDVPGNNLDEDCSGIADDSAACDTKLPITANDPFDAAKAIGLCKKSDESKGSWGVISAKWVKPDGVALTNFDGVGILDKFGVNAPQAGKSLLALSSGTARAPTDPGYEPIDNKKYTSGTPAGYPKESRACPRLKTGAAHDGVALELQIRVPASAHSISYQQNFFTSEYPTWICTEYNDFFVTMMDPKPAALSDGNIAFDQDGNPISVNNSLLQVCAVGTYKGKTFNCPLGTTALSDTGFEDHAATGWLTTSAPVEPGSEITLRFAIWDSGDGILDSTVLLDDFKFGVDPADGTQTVPSGPH